MTLRLLKYKNGLDVLLIICILNSHKIHPNIVAYFGKKHILNLSADLNSACRALYKY
jgi:hypothetical protein